MEGERNSLTTGSAGLDGSTGNGTSSAVLSISSGQPIGPIQPSVSGLISTNAAGRRTMPFIRFW